MARSIVAPNFVGNRRAQNPSDHAGRCQRAKRLSKPDHQNCRTAWAGPFPDVLTRIVATKLQARWGYPVIVENRPGAANNIGAEAVAKSPPDGYTLLSAPQGPFVIAKHFFRKLGYDPEAFVPVTVLASSAYTLIASPKSPYSTFQELIAYAKAHPDKVTYASAGTGGQPHLIGELLQYASGVRMRHVPYKAGLGQAMTDIIGGHVDLMFDNVSNTLPQIKEGKVKVLATLSETTHPGTARRSGDRGNLSDGRNHRMVRRRCTAEDAAGNRREACRRPSPTRCSFPTLRNGSPATTQSPSVAPPLRPLPSSKRNPRSGDRSLWQTASRRTDAGLAARPMQPSPLQGREPVALRLRQDLMVLVSAAPMSQAVCVAAELRLPDLLAHGPRTVGELAQATGSHAPSLHRLLRALASVGVCEECDDGSFVLGNMGALAANRRAEVVAVLDDLVRPPYVAGLGQVERQRRERQKCAAACRRDGRFRSPGARSEGRCGFQCRHGRSHDGSSPTSGACLRICRHHGGSSMSEAATVRCWR